MYKHLFCLLKSALFSRLCIEDKLFLKTVFFSERDGVTASEKKKMVGGIINSSSTHFQETRKK